MKKTRRGARAFVLAVLMVVCLIPRTALAVSPKSLKTFKGTTTIYEMVPYAFTSGSVKGLKTSNSKVVKARVEYGHYDERTMTSKNVVLLTPGKAGKATVSFSIGSKRYKMKVVVKKRAIAAKQVKIAMFNWKKGGKSINIGAGEYVSPNKVLSGKARGAWCWTSEYSRVLKVKPASGWKVKRIDFVNWDGSLRLKNGGKVPKGDGYYNFDGTIFITMQNKSNGGIETIILDGVS